MAGQTAEPSHQLPSSVRRTSTRVGAGRSGRGSSGEKLDVVSAFQSYGELIAGKLD